MKKLSKIIICLVFVMALFCGSAAALAAEDDTDYLNLLMIIPERHPFFESCADELNALGLFRGSDLGYELDRSPKRLEAGIMLLRLLGLEEIALAGDCKHPFTDVPEWADKIVGYLYENNLTNGISKTRFGSDNNCDPRMYVTFVLRTLGYSDKDGDFTYEDSLTFGMSVGVIDKFILSTPFLRDNMVAVSFLSLHTATADGEYDTLLEKLVADRVVSTEAAKTVLDRNQYYTEIRAAFSEARYNVSYGAKTIGESTNYGEVWRFEYTFNIAVRMDNGKLSMRMYAYSPIWEPEVGVKYYKDGYMYYCLQNGETWKVRMPQDYALSELYEVFQDMGMVPLVAGSMSPIYMVKSVTKEVAGNYIVHTETNTPVLEEYNKYTRNSHTNGINTVTKYYINKDGSPDKITCSTSTLFDSASSESIISEQYNFKFGDEVKIVFPEDLGSYEDKTDEYSEVPQTVECQFCEYIYQGVKVPNFCPVCDASKEAFQFVEE